MFRGLSLAIVLIAIVVGATLLTDYEFDARPLLLVPIGVAAWSGLRAGLLVTALSVGFAAYSLTEPYDSFDRSKWDDSILIALAVTGVLASGLSFWFRRAQSRLLRSRYELGFLNRSAEAVLRARTPEEIARIAVSASTEELGATAGLVAVRGAAISGFRAVTAEGFKTELIEALMQPAGTPIADAFFLQRPIFSPQDELPVQYPAIAAAGPQLEAVMAVPLTVKGREHGVLCLSFPAKLRQRAQETRLLITFASQIAQGLDASELLVSANRQGQEFQILSEASLAFSEAELEEGPILRKLADLCCEHLADFAVAYKLSSDRRYLEPIAQRSRRSNASREDANRVSRVLVGEGLSGGVAATERGRILLQKAPEFRNGTSPNDGVSPTDIFSTLSVPIVARSEVFGVLTLEREGPEQYKGTHAELAQEVARRAALALVAANESAEAQQELRLRRRIEEALRANQSELRAALEAKNEFLGLVSHELRTPLTIIRGNADVLRRRPDLAEPDRNQALADIGADSERLHRIVENMLYLARLDVGKLPELEPVLLYRVISEALDEFGREAPKASVCQTSVDNRLVVRGNEGYIRQVLQNLLSNAMKYSPPGSPIEVEVAVAEHFAEVSVCDRGIGIAADKLTDFFKPFYRANDAGPHVSGMGIGLAVCKRLIEAQGGTIEATPREGGGSIFSFRLPVWDEFSD
jgi:signal transduction histidine kinase